jgi:hypothetical protein
MAAMHVFVFTFSWEWLQPKNLMVYNNVASKLSRLHLIGCLYRFMYNQSAKKWNHSANWKGNRIFRSDRKQYIFTLPIVGKVDFKFKFQKHQKSRQYFTKSFQTTQTTKKTTWP